MKHTATIVVVLVWSISQSAYAVCFFPGTDLSGYRIPLSEEITTSAAIAIGKVIQSKELNEDASEPDYPTAYLYTFELSRILKGEVPQNIEIKAPNDSGGYRMSVGEEHLLFLGYDGSKFVADTCGNSTELAKGNETLALVERELGSNAGSP